MDAGTANGIVGLSHIFSVEEKEETPPDPSRMILALRQVGYNLEQAISDLLDNSIAAGADTILVRFLCDSNRIRSLAIIDNGSGMSRQELKEAMRFGSSRDRERNSLGKFGMGLKLASFSHARSLSVLTRRREAVHGRRWTLEGIEAGWQCDVLASDDVVDAFCQSWGGLDLSESGTVILWEDVDRFNRPAGGLRNALKQIQRRLQVHLGLTFHRFLEEGNVRILMDQQVIGVQEHGIRVSVKPLDPFAYPVSGAPGYPKLFPVAIDGVGEIEAEAHIWPPNSELPEYRLGQKAAARQGFFFYRNGRLIQTGGWNGIVQHDAEPHSSLARVRIDLPSDLDTRFGLNVQKSGIVVPEGFEAAIENSRSDDDVSFDDFRHKAQQVYRKHDRSVTRLYPIVPRKGIPMKILRAAADLEDPDAEGYRSIDIMWEELPEDLVFDIDRNNGVLRLNSTWRQPLLCGLPASGTDIPVVKTLLFLLLKDEFNHDRLSAQRRARLDGINMLLREAILMEKG